MLFVLSIRGEYKVKMKEEERNVLQFDNTQTIDTKGNPVLGRLEGPCADTINATRNGRKYSNELWKKVFNNPVVKEYFKCGGVFGELGHPADRQEIDLEKVCVCMPRPPVPDDNGLLIGTWDILNTPNGKILKCLCDYGYKLGISSRGSGDIVEDMNGNESVDPDTYEFNAFDVVFLPAVEKARLNLVNESLQTKTLKRALNEAIEKADDSEKKIMLETLKDLNIEYQPEKVDSNIEASEDEEADNNGSKLEEELQAVIKDNANLQLEIKSLNEKLSVCYAKEMSLNEELSKYKVSIRALVKSNKEFQTHENELLESKNLITEQEKVIDQLKRKFVSETSKQKTLQENLKIASKEKISSLVEELQKNKTLLESTNNEYSKYKDETEKTISQLTESITELKTNNILKEKQQKQKIEKALKLVENYKAIANHAVDKYIGIQALKLGVTKEEIKNKLKESYTFDDIDTVCEGISNYQLKINNLPFNVSKSPVKVSIKESKESILTGIKNDDDDIDDVLKNLMN